MKHYQLYAGLLAGSLAAITGVALQPDRLSGPQHRNRADIRAGGGARKEPRAGIVTHEHPGPVHPPVPQPNYARPASYPSNGYPWPHFPITVAFDNSWTAHPANRVLVIAGFNQWVIATNGHACYQVVSGQSGDVTIHFNPRLECGYTDSDCENRNGTRRMIHADMHLGGIDADRMPIPPDVFQAAAAHEFGHALGIIQHSPYSSDLMFPELRNQMNVSPRDLAAINRIYGW